MWGLMNNRNGLIDTEDRLTADGFGGWVKKVKGLSKKKKKKP